MRNFSTESKVKMSGSEKESEQEHEATIFFLWEHTDDISFLQKNITKTFHDVVV